MTSTLKVLLAVGLASSAGAQTSERSDGDHVKPIAIAGVIGAAVGTGLGVLYVSMNCEIEGGCDGTRAEFTGLVVGAAVGVIIGFFIEYGERPGQRQQVLITFPERKPLQRAALSGAPRIPYLDGGRIRSQNDGASRK
jgi:hypothetical protein